MKKVIYIPRRKQGDININYDVTVEPGTRAYLHSFIASNNIVNRMLSHSAFFNCVEGDGALGYVNIVDIEQKSYGFDVHTTLEAFPAFVEMLWLFNQPAENCYRASSISVTPFSTPAVSRFNVPYKAPVFESSEIMVDSLQDVFVDFRNMSNANQISAGSQNLLFIVNKNHFNSDYEHFIYSGNIGSAGMQPSFNHWSTLANVLCDGLNNYFNIARPFNTYFEVYGQNGYAQTRVLFPNCGLDGYGINVNNINMRFRKSNSTPEGMGLDVNQFNAVINI